ncbi:VOC family protein [Modestobacter sp. NPDC049651]|uniref:VOC family protein n=1 Tax=unclassified Modestobacter TaxID=2643866 RepID=UPI0033E40520
MPTRDVPWPAGTPCWVDYNAVELTAARAFYSDLFGWEYAGGDPSSGGYLFAVVDGRPAAGLMPRQSEDDGPAAWTTYFATDDAEATAERITAAGGTVVAPPMAVLDQGSFAIALDPEGNVFGLWEAGGFIGENVFNEPGTVVWNEAAVEDPAGAREFYSAVFGHRWTEIPESGGYSTFAVDDRPLGGLGGLGPDLPRGWTTCFSVVSADDAVRRLEAGGGKVLLAAQDSPYGRFAVGTDLWGAPFSVMQETDS